MARGAKVTLKFVPDFANVIGRQADTRAILHDAALDALEVARDTAPITTGHYEESLEVDDNVLLTTDPVGHLVEWGSINNRAYGTLRNAASEVAKRIEEDPR